MISAIILTSFLTTFLNPFPTTEAETLPDTIRLQEVEVIPLIKEDGLMRQQPSSVTLLGQKELAAGHVTSLKSAAALAPNFFIPDYGSRLTSAIYIRGIGSRINTPAVGMYVDDIPYVDKSAFDFNFYDIERLDVLRGPQATLYGRNTMGGLVKVYTRNPFYYSGTDAKISLASGDTHRSISLMHYHRINNEFAFSVGGYYEGSNGFFRNDQTGKKADKMQAGGGRLRALWLPSEDWKFDLTVGYDYSDEGAYPYYYKGVTSGEEKYQQCINKITNNRESNYRRSLFNAGLNIEHRAETWQMNAITGYQHIGDRMFMDQDFLSADIYTLEQRQRINTLTEELTFKNRTTGHWQWVSGANFMYQWLHTDGPVTFYKDGVSTLIEGNVNGIFSRLQQLNQKMPTMDIALKDKEFVVSSLMDTPSLDLALFHNSTFTFDHWKFTLGLRLEYEPLRLKYYSNSDITFDFNIKMPSGMTMPYPDLKAQPKLEGELSHDYLQWLPKVSAMYQWDNGSNLYATISKGYRSGGYNVQMFSDLIQGEMRNQMMTGINEAGKGMVEKMLGTEGYQALMTTTDVSSVSYKPEYLWNYELGTHLTLADHTLMLDGALFYSRIYDQQIARFADSGFGRMMVNAGKSESYGAELSMRYTPTRQLALTANYGYTHATFLEYEDRKDADYSGNRVPFVPEHNLSLDAAYSWFLGHSDGDQRLTLGASYSGTGNIYWTEDNLHRQPFYGLVGARLAYESPRFTLSLWGKNLFNRHYNTFFFESAQRGFEQHGKPVQVGVDITLHF